MGTFKSGTNTLENLLKKNTEFNIERRHVNIDIIKKNHYDYIVFPFRDNKDVYPSAFFQDITKKEYIYSPYHKDNFLSNFSDLSEVEKREQIINTKTEDLLNLYKKIDWDKCHDNNKFRDQISEIFNIKIKDCDEIQIFDTINPELKNKIKIICLKTDALSREEYIEELISYFGYKLKTGIIHSNNSQDKWYKKKYNSFLLELKK